MPSSWLLQGHIASDSSTPSWRSPMLLEGQQIPAGGAGGRMMQLHPSPAGAGQWSFGAGGGLVGLHS